MPRGDRTGPSGMGPMTGRGAGYCAGYPTPGYMNPGWGRGGGGGRGRGFFGGYGQGWRHRHWYFATGVPGWQRAQAGWGWPGDAAPFAEPLGPTLTREEELDSLKRQAKGFAQALDELHARIREIETSENTPSREKEKAKP